MTQVDNRLLYDTHWHAWEEIKRWGPMSRHARRLVFKVCRKLAFSSVLDVGCGPGIFLEEVGRRYPSVRLAGVDLSSAAIEQARRRLPQADLWVMDVAVEIPGTRFSLVTLIDVAEHIEEDLAAFRNLRGLCTGHLLVCTLEGRMRGFEKDIGHVRNYRPGELEGKLREAGFEVRGYLRWGWPCYSPLYRNLSSGIDAHRKRITFTRQALARLAYWLLFCNWPGQGDLVIALARPRA